jgi:hypothetical protein
MESGGWKEVSEGRIKSPGRTEDMSAPPKTLPSCSITVLCQRRGLLDFLVESIARSATKVNNKSEDWTHHLVVQVQRQY